MSSLSNARKHDANHVMSGALARATAAIIMCPADTIKTRLQFQGNNPAVQQYRGVSHAFATILKNEGPMAFTRGLAARLLYVLPSAGVSFWCYEKVVAAFRQPESNGDPLLSAVLPVAGIATARLLGTTLRTPFDVIKLRLQVQGSFSNGAKYRNTFQAMSDLWRMEGIRGTLKFVPISVMRDAPFAFFYFAGYELMKNVQRSLFYRSENPSETVDISKLRAWNHLLAGAGAGAMASTLTIPFDVVKTRLQAQAASDKQKYTGIVNAFATILKEEGARGLTRGLGARLIYITPAAAIVFTSYEQYKKFFDYVLPTKEMQQQSS